MNYLVAARTYYPDLTHREYTGAFDIKRKEKYG